MLPHNICISFHMHYLIQNHFWEQQERYLLCEITKICYTIQTLLLLQPCFYNKDAVALTAIYNCSPSLEYQQGIKANCNSLKVYKFIVFWRVHHFIITLLYLKSHFHEDLLLLRFNCTALPSVNSCKYNIHRCACIVSSKAAGKMQIKLNVYIINSITAMVNKLRNIYKILW